MREKGRKAGKWPYPPFVGDLMKEVPDLRVLNQGEFSPWPPFSGDPMTTDELHAMVRMLQTCTPLGELSNMSARVVFELLLQRGWTITKPPTGEFSPHQPKETT
jgi:hypothetical protein